MRWPILLLIPLSCTACESVPADCEVSETVVSPTETSRVGFTWEDVSIPGEFSLEGAYGAPLPAVPTRLNVKLVTMDDTVTALEMTASEPSHFSGSTACTSRLSRSIVAEVSTEDGRLAGEFTGEARAFAQSEFTLSLQGDPSSFAGIATTASDRLDLAIVVREGTANVDLVGVNAYALGDDGSGADLTTLFSANDVPLEVGDEAEPQ